jgi:hypothetical protein
MKIYHFLSSRYAIENIQKRRIKISKLDNLNDPFELVAANNINEDQRKLWEEWRKTQALKLGLVCFSRTWKNPVLWSHYADRHKGMCLGFEVPDKAVNEVIYTKNRLNIDLFKLSSQGKLTVAHMSKMFRTKYIDWKYEREARVFANLEKIDESSGLYFHDFDHEMKLTEIFIGPLCQESESDVRAHLQPEELSVKILKTRIAYKTFDVVLLDSKH